jgi:murein DD-endopeptidase MepM/ murein hydrolase activator NlpD
MLRPLLPVLVLAVLAGCAGRAVAPAPFELHRGAGAPALSEPAGPHPDRVTVANGDTLYGLSRRWGVPMRAIIEANGLAPPYRLVAGTALMLPQVRTHAVQAGDTLASVARRYGVDASTLAATNHLAPPFVIRTGEVLILPAPVETARAAPPAPRPAPLPVASAPPLALPQAAASAAPGQRIVSVSPLAGAGPAAGSPPPPRIIAVSPLAASVPAPAAAPAAPPPERLAAVSPPSALPAPPPPPPVAAAPPPAPAPSIAAVAPPPAPAPTALPASAPAAVPSAPPAAAPADVPEAPSAEARAADKLASLPPAAVSGKGFIWPVRGRVISTYGTDSEGTHNDGINIAAPAGAPVLAAEAGEVAYAGNELKGYGNLILLKHANGFVSAYAHNETLLVKRGDKVVRGQPIAKVGATGAVTQPQLHFELRRGAKALDPAEYLPVTAATASR